MNTRHPSSLFLLAVLGFAVARAQTPSPASAGLVAHWSFDTDFSSSANQARYGGTPHGGVRIDRSPGVARVGEGALQLGGDVSGPAYVSVAEPPSGLRGTAELTLCGWFKASSPETTTDSRRFVWESFPNSGLAFSVSAARGRTMAQFRFRSENFRVLTDVEDFPLDPGRWHHVAAVWNAPRGIVRCYLDGRLVKELPMRGATVGADVPARPNPDGTWPQLEPVRGLNLGGNKLGDGREDWRGWLDDIAIYDVELTPRQIAALAQGDLDGRKVSAENVLQTVAEPATQHITPAATVPPPRIPAPESMQLGPLLGHVDARQAVVWARVPTPGPCTLVAQPPSGPAVRRALTPEEARDWCLSWHLENLEPATPYHVTFELPSTASAALPSLDFRTPPLPGVRTQVSLGFGSCADYPENPIWTRIAEHCPDGMVMLGDTPYIDSTDLKWMRWAYRRFSSSELFATAFRRVPLWATWDDHDFGKNDADGTLPGKQASRESFVEYRPLAQIGENNVGAYTSFRRGPVEVFLLDTRWFSRTEPSWADPSKPTLLGRQQWEWLKRGLKASTAPFKVLACGIIWDAKKNSKETDAWGYYVHEREALFRWLGTERISGVVLVGGDIHVSRLMRFPVRTEVGYDLFEFITSPMHDRIFPQSNTPDPNLLGSAVEPWVFLKLVADDRPDDPTLHAELMNRDGVVFFSRDLRLSELSPPVRS